MSTEIEATFIDINKDDLRARLRAAGGRLIQTETLMKRTIFHISEGEFARVRDEGNRITMSYKHVKGLSLSGTQEICLEVNDYDEAVEFLKSIGLEIKAQQETLREEWELDGVELDIDTWPWLPTFVEIEGPSEDAVKATAARLGLAMENAIYGSVDQVYKVYYDVTSDDINMNLPEIKFTDVPDWIEAKRRPEPLFGASKRRN